MLTQFDLSPTGRGEESGSDTRLGVQFDYRIKQNVNAFVSVEGQALSDSSLVGATRGGVEVKF